jgi:benzoylformate decarboxylase
VVAVAEQLGAPVYTTWLTGLQFPTTHPLWGGVLDLWTAHGRETLRGADAVLAVGTEVFQSMWHQERPLLAEGARVVHLHSSPWELGKNEPSVAVQADEREALCALLPLLRERQGETGRAAARKRGAAVAERLTEERAARRAHWRQGWDERPIRPGRLMAELLEALPRDAILIDDGVTSGAPLRDLLEMEQPGRYYNTRGGGSLGWGIGAAIGVSLAKPGAEVVAVLGDGTALMVIQGLWNAAEQRLPIKFVVCDNGSYRILKVNARRLLGGEAHQGMPGLDFDAPRLDFEQIAEGLGVPASRVQEPAALGGALRELFGMTGPGLLDVVIDPAV